MAKISIDINYIKDSLEKMGYAISDCVERENNGSFWQFKFSNSSAVVSVYDTNKKNNSMVGGKIEEEEKECLKEIVDKLKCKELQIDPMNRDVVDLINNQEEKDYCDFKVEFHQDKGDLLHDILCLSNNTGNRDAFLIFGVADNGDVVGIKKKLSSNNLFDFLREIKFAGGHMPDVEVKNLYYCHKNIGVIVCKSSKFVPFYLTERYRKVMDHQIYTRVGDTNTPANKHAEYCDIEKLWRIHFERENEQ